MKPFSPGTARISMLLFLNLMFDDEASARSALASFKESKTANGETILGERISLAPQPQALPGHHGAGNRLCESDRGRTRK